MRHDRQFNRRRTDRQTPRQDAYTRARRERDASAGWREELRHQDVPVPDGGRHHTLPSPGAIARDRESDDGDELLVVAVLEGVRADAHRIDATGQTVYEHNPTYDGESPVVKAVYRADLEPLARWRSLADVRTAAEHGAVRAYAFPVGRMKTLDEDPGLLGGESA